MTGAVAAKKAVDLIALVKPRIMIMALLHHHSPARARPAPSAPAPALGTRLAGSSEVA